MRLKRGNDLKAEWNKFISDGDESAYYQIYSHYHKYFFYLGIKKGALSEKIGDCLHDLFLYVFENREKLFHIKNHHNYLITTFLHSLFKKQHFSSEESEQLTSIEDLQTMHAADERILVKDTNDQVRHVLQNYIDELSVSQARMVYEKFYLGLSYEEIAKAHNITLRTAYNTTFNAVYRLRILIGDHKLASLIATITTLSLIFFLFYL